MAEVNTKDENFVLNWVSSVYLTTENALNDARTKAKRQYRFVKGDIHDDDVLARRKKRGLPILPLNIILPKIIRLSGAEKRIRSDMKATPRMSGSVTVADLLTKIFRSVTNLIDGLRERRDALIDMVISDTGGWIQAKWTNDNDIMGFPTYERINTFAVGYDPQSTRYDLKDARYVYKRWWATIDDLLRDYGDTPEKRQKIRELDEFRKPKFGKRAANFIERQLPEAVTPAWQKITGSTASFDDRFIHEKENMFLVIEMEIREQKSEKRLFDALTQDVLTSADDDEREGLKKANPNLIEIDFNRDHIRVVTTVGGTRLLLQDTPADVQNEMFSLIPYWGYNFDGENFSPVRNLMAPQEEYVAARQSAVHIQNILAAPKTWIKRGSMKPEELEKFLKHGTSAGYVGIYEDQKPEIDSMQFPPTGLFSRGEAAKQDAEEIMGIGPNSVGRSDTSQESGELVKTRVAETIEMLQHIFDNKERSDRLLFQYIIDMSQTKFQNGRVVNIFGENGDIDEKIILDEAVDETNIRHGKFMVAIERGTAQHFRREKLNEIIALAAVIPPELMRYDLVIKKYDGITDEEKEEWIQFIRAVQQSQVVPEVQALQQDINNRVEQTLGAVTGDADKIQKQISERTKQAA